MRNKKFRTDFLQEIAMMKKQNHFRYFVALNLLDDSGHGWVSYTTSIKRIASHLSVTQKTAKHNIDGLHLMGWIDIFQPKDRVYYKSQEKIMALYDFASASHLATIIEWSDLACTLIEWRAFVYEATLPNGTPVARETIRTRINGSSRPTQYKYENARKIKSAANYQIVDRQSDLYEFIYKYGTPLFERIINGVLELCRQLPNCYYPEVAKGKRKRKTKGLTNLHMPNRFSRLYNPIGSDFQLGLLNEVTPLVWR